jgi:hypothetical protein
MINLIKSSYIYLLKVYVKKFINMILENLDEQAKKIKTLIQKINEF